MFETLKNKNAMGYTTAGQVARKVGGILIKAYIIINIYIIINYKQVHSRPMILVHLLPPARAMVTSTVNYLTNCFVFFAEMPQSFCTNLSVYKATNVCLLNDDVPIWGVTAYSWLLHRYGR